MTFEEIKASKKDMLTTADVAPILQCMPYTINVQAHNCPEKLGFPVVVIGRRVKIPKQGFVKFWEGA